MSAPLASDDVVATHAAAASNAREPLVVIEPLRQFLEQQGLADRADPQIVVEPLGEGHSNVTLLLRARSRRRPPACRACSRSARTRR